MDVLPSLDVSLFIPLPFSVSKNQLYTYSSVPEYSEFFPLEDLHICCFPHLKSAAFTFRLFLIPPVFLAGNFTSQRNFLDYPQRSTSLRGLVYCAFFL